MNDDITFILGILVGMIFAVLLYLFLREPECQVVERPAKVEYAARGGQPGGYWIADGKVIGFSYAEDDPIKGLACFPELKD